MMQSLACNICGGSLRQRFKAVEDPQTLENFAINECVTCGLGHTVFYGDDLSCFYGDDYYGSRHGFTASYRARRRLQLVTRMVGAGGGRRLLDVGCGDGTFLLAAQAKGWRVVGTEAHPRIAQAAGLDVRESIGEVKDCSPFFCITLWHSLEHMKDPVALLESLVSVLAPDGVILIAVPDAEGIQAQVFRSKWFHLDLPRHLYHFGHRSLARLFVGSGLTITHQWHQEFEYDLMGWLQSALNIIMPRPNGLFRFLTGRSNGDYQKVADCILGTITLPFALPLTFIGTLLNRGGTLIVAGVKSQTT